jgi:hypothetical protein
MTARPTTRRTPLAVAAPFGADAEAAAFRDAVVAGETIGTNPNSSRIRRVRSALGA